MAEAAHADKAIASRDAANLPALLFHQAGADPEAPLLWWRDKQGWHSLTRRDVADRVRALAVGLRDMGLARGERVTLVCENRPEFLIADVAIMTAGGISVPAYTTNTIDDHQHILDDSESAMAIVSTASLAKRLLPAAARAEACRHVITMETVTGHEDEANSLHLWDDVLARGRGHLARREGNGHDPLGTEPEPDDIAALIYTSGTGGLPKGVMLTHRNILANCNSILPLLTGTGLELDREVFLSFLPLSHAYEHTAGQFFPLAIGAQIYYSRGVEQLAKEMAEVRPTIMTAVPRLYELLHQRIASGLRKQPKLRQRLFHHGLELGRRRLRGKRLGPVGWLADRILDRLVRRKVREQFGGRLKAMVSGGAALSPDLGEFFVALGLPLLQGYGQTEAAPVISFNPPGRERMTTVGLPLDGVACKVADDGELLVRGLNVMKGYWRLPEATARTVKDGWLHTGDLARIDADGYIEITDRKKDIVVLSGGDTLSPARVENALTRQPEVAQAMVHGDKRPHLVALIVPDTDFAREWAAERGQSGDLDDLAANPDFQSTLDDAVRRVNKQMSPMERIRRFTVAPEPFTVDNDMLTPTLKIRRHKIREQYGANLEALY